MESLVLNRISGVFIPVKNIEAARDWYCRLLKIASDGEIYFGHIYVLPMQGGTSIILDSKIYAPGKISGIPLLQLAVDNIEEAYAYMKSKNVACVTGIENGHWFNIKDPDGNIIMICK